MSIMNGVVKLKKNKVFLMLGLAFFMTVGGILLSKNVSNSGIKASESIKLETNKETTTIGETFQLALKEPEILKTAGEEETAVEEKKATIIPLPEGLSFDEQRTNQANDAQVDYTISWNEEKRQIEVVWLTQQNLNEVQLVVTGVTEGVYDIDASRLVGGMEEVSNKIVLSVTTPKATEENPIIRTPRIGNLNMDMDISPAIATTIDSGKDAVYKLNLKTTGAMTTYKNALLVVTLPDLTEFTQDVSELTIAGVQPEYDAVTHSLTYRFPELVTGQAYQVNIAVSSVNGSTPNGELLTINARLSADNFPEVNDDATIKVSSSIPISVTKTYVGVEGKGPTEGPKPGDIIIWSVKASVSPKESGLLFLKENQKIDLSDTLTNDLSYVGTTSEAIPTQNGQKITWLFDGPSLLEQQKSLENSEDLWSTEFLVKTKVSASITDTKKIVNSVSTKILDLNNNITEIKSPEASVVVATGGNNGESPAGTWLYETHKGPFNGKGQYNINLLNPVPTVTDIGTLAFSHPYYIDPYQREVYSDSEKKVPYNWNNETVFKNGYEYVGQRVEIDTHLKFERISIGKPFHRAKSSSPVTPLNILPEVMLKLEVNTKGNWITFIVDNSVLEKDNGVILKRTDLGLNINDHVLSYETFYKNNNGLIEGGFASNTMTAMYTIEKGYTGVVTNKMWEYGKVAGSATPFYRYPSDDSYNNGSAIGSRSANVVGAGSTNPIISTAISILNNKGNIVTPGSNQVKFMITNEASSQKRLSGPISAVVILPEGVTLEGTNDNAVVLTNDYENKGRQAIQVSFEEPDLIPKPQFYAESFPYQVSHTLNVNIAENAPSPLNPIVYGFSGENKLDVPTYSSENLTNTVLEVDSDDLNGDGNTTKNRVKSSNSYYMLREGNVQTEKSVKGSEDSTFSKFGHTVPDGDIEYQLDLTNTTDEAITSFTLMDVLPSVGDLGITDGVNRESTFAPKMTGPIQVPEEWKDKVTVSYSTEANPKRDDLTKNVDYPVSTQKIENPAGAADPKWMSEGSITDWSSISSFKIELKPSASWVKGQNIKLNFMMKAPSYEEITDKNLLNATIDEKSRAAWNSFAYAANRLQVVEPERVGVVMNELGKVRIQKVDSEDKNQTLEGASFVIAESEAQLKNGKTIKLDENGKLVYPSDDNYSDSMKDYQLTSTNKGILEFDKLRLGGVDGDTYYLKEVEAPKGYQLLTTYVKVTAAPEDSLVLIQVMNTKKVVMPQTGSMRIVLFIVLGLGLVGTGIVYYINKQGERVVGEAKRKK